MNVPVKGGLIRGERIAASSRDLRSASSSSTTSLTGRSGFHMSKKLNHWVGLLGTSCLERADPGRESLLSHPRAIIVGASTLTT